MPEAIARQLDWCDCCHRKTHRKDLVWQQRRHKQPVAMNLLEYSEYDSSGWSASGAGTDKSTITMGHLSQEARVRVADDNTNTEVNGVQTWQGTKKLRSSTVIDMTGSSGHVFSCWVSIYQGEAAEASLTVSLGYYDGSAESTERTWTVTSDKQVWINLPASTITGNGDDPSTIQFQVQVAPADSSHRWSAGRFQVETGVTRPSRHFVSTAGSAINRTSETIALSVAKACPECREPLDPIDSEGVGRPRTFVEPTVPFVDQKP